MKIKGINYIIPKDFIDMVMPPFPDRCRFCKLAMPSEGKWQVSTEEA